MAKNTLILILVGLGLTSCAGLFSPDLRSTRAAAETVDIAESATAPNDETN